MGQTWRPRPLEGLTGTFPPSCRVSFGDWKSPGVILSHLHTQEPTARFRTVYNSFRFSHHFSQEDQDILTSPGAWKCACISVSLGLLALPRSSGIAVGVESQSGKLGPPSGKLGEKT